MPVGIEKRSALVVDAPTGSVNIPLSVEKVPEKVSALVVDKIATGLVKFPEHMLLSLSLTHSAALPSTTHNHRSTFREQVNVSDDGTVVHD